MAKAALFRASSLAEAKRLGYATNPALPLLDADLTLRAQQEILPRMLALHCVVACSYGFPKHRALAWLARESPASVLTVGESAFLHGPGTGSGFHTKIECLWVFAWAFKMVDHLDFAQCATDALVTLYPDLQNDETIAQWMTSLTLRDEDEVIAACDLAYCLHWAINEFRIDRRTQIGVVRPYVIVERRRALEWLVSREEWTDVPLDT